MKVVIIKPRLLLKVSQHTLVVLQAEEGSFDCVVHCLRVTSERLVGGHA